jgi:hypothetical protein
MQLRHLIRSGCCPVAKAVCSDDAPPVKGRIRDLLPLPRLADSLQAQGVHSSDDVVFLANVCLAGLNCLERGGKFVTFPSHTATKAQRGVQQHVLDRCQRMLERLGSICVSEFALESGVERYEPASQAPPPRLCADKVDHPPQGATCNPEPLLGATLTALWQKMDHIFPSCKVGVSGCRMRKSDMPEYSKIVAHQLCIGKLGLVKHPRGVGSVFPVPKSGDRLRLVWHGGKISDLALRPPAPRRLGNPAALLDVIVSRDADLFLSKRDAASFFDVLKAPSCTQPWFCSPPLRAWEVAIAMGCTVQGLAAHAIDFASVDLDADDLLYPSSLSWPMGFSWSSAIAQDVSLGVLRSAGMSEDQVICDSMPPPDQQDELALVLTDDTLFLHTSRAAAVERLAAFDQAMHKLAIPRRVDKDVNCASSMVGMGCEISCKPPRVDPDIAKLWPLLLAVLGMASGVHCSPHGVNSMLGVAQWFCLLSRPHYSVFNDVYAFVRRQPVNVRCKVPSSVANEMFLFLALAPLLTASLDRDYVPMITACDAAPAYGFGASVAPACQKELRDLGRLAERRGDFVRLGRDGDPDDEPERDRIGTPHTLDLCKHDFSDVICIRASRKEHSSVMEAKGLLLLIRWVLRSAKHQHSRLLALVDAKAILSAAAKGRTSSPMLKCTMCSISAYLLAGDVLLRPLYVPSEDNPADSPSRGVRRRPLIRRRLKVTHSRLERQLHKLDQKYSRLQASGMLE